MSKEEIRIVVNFISVFICCMAFCGVVEGVKNENDPEMIFSFAALLMFARGYIVNTEEK